MTRMWCHRNVVSIRRVALTALPILFSLAVSLLLLVLVRQYWDYKQIVDDTSAWSVYYTVYGVLYAIIVGFLLVEALSKYNKLSEFMEEEINALQDVRDFSLYLNCQPETSEQILNKLTSYARSVINKEWPQMEKGTTVGNMDTTRELYEVLAAITRINVTTKVDELALKILMEKMADITTVRTKRLSVVHQRLPVRLKILLNFMSFILVGGLMMLGVHSVTAHVLMVLSLTASVHLLQIVVMDLDDPFHGVWALKPLLFEEFVNRYPGSAERTD